MSPIATGRALLDPEQILNQAGLETGMYYADFGAGALGHFVFPAANTVGKTGQVFAVDILKSAISAIESRLKMEDITNVKAVWGDIERLSGSRLPPNSCDLVSIINVAGLIKKSPTVLKEAKRVLKPEGRLLVIGWDPDDDSALGPDRKSRVSPDKVRSIAGEFGYKQINPFRAGPHHWGLLFDLA